MIREGHSRNGGPGVLKKTKVAGGGSAFYSAGGMARGGDDLDGRLELSLL